MPAPYTALPLDDIHSAADATGHIQHHDDLAFYVNGAVGDGRLLAQTFNGKYASSSATPSPGVVMVTRISTPKPLLITNIETVVATAPTGTAQANVYLGLYDVNTLARLALTLDQSTNLTTGGTRVCPLTGTFSWAGGVGTSLYVAVLVGTQAGTTQMQLARPSGTGNSSTPNFDYTGSQFACAQGGSGLTALPSTLPTLSANGSLLLFGLS